MTGNTGQPQASSYKGSASPSKLTREIKQTESCALRAGRPEGKEGEFEHVQLIRLSNQHGGREDTSGLHTMEYGEREMEVSFQCIIHKLANITDSYRDRNKNKFYINMIFGITELYNDNQLLLSLALIIYKILSPYYLIEEMKEKEGRKEKGKDTGKIFSLLTG